MIGINRVILIGNLTATPELRQTSSGAAVVEVSLAVNSKKRDGGDDVYFANLVFWERNAENVAAYAKKGAPLYVEGRLKLEVWTGRDGAKRERTRVLVDVFRLLGGRRDDDEASYQQPQRQQQRAQAPTYWETNDDGGDIPF